MFPICVLFPLRTVHPRTRGEHCCSMNSHTWNSGSSPHTRGTFPRRARRWPRARFIPAHAGNMKTKWCPMFNGAVHPRTRGEHINKLSDGLVSDGSSPHTRGTCHGGGPSPWSGRFIPAHAGNIAASATANRCSTVHPRTRGEHPTLRSSCAARPGSSPHTRGTFRQHALVRAIYRFIPAHAGNIWSRRTHRPCSTVHPRTRGEHVMLVSCGELFSGSSPHTRGT